MVKIEYVEADDVVATLVDQVLQRGQNCDCISRQGTSCSVLVERRLLNS
jgi:hypothetical protein